MNSRSQASIANIPLVDDDSFNKSFFSHVADSWQSQYSKKCHLYWCLSHQKFDFIYQDHNRTQSTCRRVINENVIVFLPFIRILIVRNFQRKHFNFSRYSNLSFTKTTRFISPIRVNIESFLVIENFSMAELSICSPCISVPTVRNFRKV